MDSLIDGLLALPPVQQVTIGISIAAFCVSVLSLYFSRRTRRLEWLLAAISAAADGIAGYSAAINHAIHLRGTFRQYEAQGHYPLSNPEWTRYGLPIQHRNIFQTHLESISQTLKLIEDHIDFLEKSKEHCNRELRWLRRWYVPQMRLHSRLAALVVLKTDIWAVEATLRNWPDAEDIATKFRQQQKDLSR